MAGHELVKVSPGGTQERSEDTGGTPIAFPYSIKLVLGC